MKVPLHEAQVRSLREMTLAQRLSLNATLWDHARALKEAALRQQHADWPEERIREAAREAMQHAAR